MAAKVCVKRVVIDYVTEGRAFTIELNPMAVASIVFSPDDLKRATAMQQALSDAGLAVPGIKNPPDTFLKFGPIPPSRGVTRFAERTDASAEELTDDGPSLWWHTNTCTWLHPAEQG